LKNNKSFIILGSGGNSLVLLDIIREYPNDIHGVCDPAFKDSKEKKWNDISILGDDSYIESLDKDEFYLVNGIGGLKSTAKIRTEIFNNLTNIGFIFPKLIHKFSYIAPSSFISNGVQIMAGVIIQPNAVIEENVLINTNSSVDHDSLIGSNTNIAPGVTICGSCHIGKNVFIGTGSTIINGISIGDNSFIRAGSVVTENLPKNYKF